MHEIIVSKTQRLLHVRQSGREIFTCPIGLGPCPTGHKQSEGDGRTPEGEYRICTRNARSKYTLFLGLSYPGPEDAQAAYERGFISKAQLYSITEAHALGTRPPWDTPLGGQIGIHGGGLRAGDALADITAGCIALLDDDIRSLWVLAPLHTRVVIVP